MGLNHTSFKLYSCIPVFRLKMVGANVMVYIGNESLFINKCTIFGNSERMMAKYNSSYKCKTETSGPCTLVRNSAPDRGMQVCAGDQICPFCGRGISRGVHFWYLHAGNVESTLRMIEALLLKMKVDKNFSEYEKFYFNMEFFWSLHTVV